MRPLIALCALSLVACDGPEHLPPTSPAPPPVVASRLTLIASPPELPIGGGTARIRIEATGANGQPSPGATVTLSATDGAFDETTAQTDSTGHASVLWTTTKGATVHARTGDVETSLSVRVLEPPVIPPPSPIPPPTPTPPPDPPIPPIPPGPSIVVTLSAPSTFPVDQKLTVTASVSGLPSGDGVLAYQWDETNDGSNEATTTVNAYTFSYTSHGVKRVKCTVLSRQGLTSSGTAQIIITNAVR